MQASRKISKQEWDFTIKSALAERERQQVKFRKAKYAYFEKALGRFMPIPYIVGTAAAVTLILLYGWREFFKFFLGWIVSLTLVATAAFYLWRHYERKL